MPENNIKEKLIKQRHIHHLEREELADILDFHISTVRHWEVDDIMPKPESILKLCNLYKVPLNYFHKYYYIYYNSPGEKIKAWKNKNRLTYKQACELLDITHSGFGRLLSSKINLSYYTYVKLKKLGVF
jgi:transcriptional regulator with XRE-family HTH domain